MLSLIKTKEICRSHGFSTLITEPDANSKLAKSEGYYNCGISLAQAGLSGYNMCCASTPGCRSACLGNWGRAEFTPRILKARIARTKLYVSDPKMFWQVLEPQLWAIDRKAKKLKLPVAFRPNILSDQPWHSKFPQMFETFSHWQFYGYTKVKAYARQYLAGRLPPNYYLTFSWSERLSLVDARRYIKDGLNIAVPFFSAAKLSGQVPDVWNNIPVIDGDKSDLRFLDPPNVVVGLKSKLPKSISKRKQFLTNNFFTKV